MRARSGWGLTGAKPADFPTLARYQGMAAVKGTCQWCGAATSKRATWCKEWVLYPRAVLRDDGRWTTPCLVAFQGWWMAATELRRALFQRDGFACGICGLAPTTEVRGRVVPDLRFLHADHMVPLVHGGADSWANLWTLCGTCNLRKGTKTVAECAGAWGLTEAQRERLDGVLRRMVRELAPVDA